MFFVMLSRLMCPALSSVTGPASVPGSGSRPAFLPAPRLRFRFQVSCGGSSVLAAHVRSSPHQPSQKLSVRSTRPQGSSLSSLVQAQQASQAQALAFPLSSGSRPQWGARPGSQAQHSARLSKCGKAARQARQRGVYASLFLGAALPRQPGLSVRARFMAAYERMERHLAYA
jgi:hypothetical protein